MSAANAGKKYWAVLIKRSAFGLGFVFISGPVIEWIFFEPHERNGLMAGVVAVLVFLAASVAFSIINALSGLAYLWLFGGSEMQDLVLADLRSSEIPGPRPHQMKRFDYLVELADDDDESPAVRVRAGALYASYQVAVQRSGFFGGLALAKAMDEATLRYAAEAPQ